MHILRRTLLAAAPTLAAVPAWAAPKAPEFLEAYERSCGGRIGVFVHNLKTGARFAWRADERFVMCSSFKASLAAFVLQRVDHGRDRLDDRIAYTAADLLSYAPTARANVARGWMTVAEMCQAAVELSDNTCANLLLARVGGPPALTRFWRSVGDPVSRLDHNEPLLNRSPPGDPHDTTSPAAMAEDIGRFILGDVLSPASRERLKGWMVDCQTGRDLVRAGLPAGWIVGDKTGNNGKDARGDLVIAWPRPDAPILAAVYVQGGKPTEAQQVAVFQAVGRMVAERLV